MRRNSTPEVRMKKPKRVSILIAVPDSLSRAIVRAARREQVGLNDLLVGTLARYFRVKFEPTGRIAKLPAPGRPAVLLRVSPELHRELKRASVANRTNTT